MIETQLCKLRVTSFWKNDFTERVQCVCLPTLDLPLDHAANDTVVIAGVRTTDVGCVLIVGDADCSKPKKKLLLAACK